MNETSREQWAVIGLAILAMVAITVMSAWLWNF